MFTLDHQTRTFWFNFKAMEAEGEFRLVGSLIGLAVYSSVILDIHFPLAVYKKLLKQPLGFEVRPSALDPKHTEITKPYSCVGDSFPVGVSSSEATATHSYQSYKRFSKWVL